MSELKKTNIPGLVKDIKTGVIHNEDIGKYNLLLSARKRTIENKNLQQSVDDLYRQISDIRKEIQKIMSQLK